MGKTMGQVAYEAYNGGAGVWNSLDPQQQADWALAADAVVRKTGEVLVAYSTALIETVNEGASGE